MPCKQDIIKVYKFSFTAELKSLQDEKGWSKRTISDSQSKQTLQDGNINRI